jgi:hypothetical protein
MSPEPGHELLKKYTEQSTPYSSHFLFTCFRSIIVTYKMAKLGYISISSVNHEGAQLAILNESLCSHLR